MLVRIKTGQIWKDKKKGDVMRIGKRHHDIFWNCFFDRGRVTHKMSEFIIKKFYEPVE